MSRSLDVILYFGFKHTNHENKEHNMPKSMNKIMFNSK